MAAGTDKCVVHMVTGRTIGIKNKKDIKVYRFLGNQKIGEPYRRKRRALAEGSPGDEDLVDFPFFISS